MPGRTSAPYGNTNARRAVAAAVIATAALLVAANAGPAHAADTGPAAPARQAAPGTQPARP
ncbi:hypothetical protein [Streptomyces sp. NPDC046759]|uniref:hypothetical protein n=1 Tax=Streptomyces sp. NPDC046759 TaxID=3155019 RepID=UPI0033D57704